MKITIWTLPGDGENGSRSRSYATRREAYVACFATITKTFERITLLWDAVEAAKQAQDQALYSKLDSELTAALTVVRSIVDLSKIEETTLDIPVKVCVEVRGGVVQATTANLPGLDLEIVDFDDLSEQFTKEELAKIEAKTGLNHPTAT